MPTSPEKCRRGAGGRPSKGERLRFQSRIPLPLATTVVTEAERRGLNVSDYIALVLAEHHDFDMPSLRNQATTIQEVLPMQSAS